MSNSFNDFLKAVSDSNSNLKNELISIIGGTDVLLKFYIDNVIEGNIKLNDKKINDLKRLQNAEESEEDQHFDSEELEYIDIDELLDDVDNDQLPELKYNSFNVLTYGYIRDCLKILAIKQTMPDELYKMIYSYGQYNIISITFVGHVDCGKSTMLGKLLHETGAITPKEMDAITNEARSLGKESFKFAFLCDKLREERERGVSIAGSTHSFQTESNNFFIHDIPGHRDFIKNASRYIALADAAVLIVPATIGEYEANVAKLDHRRGQIGGMAPTHAQKCFTIGVKQLIVCINKMDARTVNYSQLRYNQCQKELKSILKKIGYNIQKNVLFIPTSSWRGDNIRTKSINMDWYNGFPIPNDCRGYTLYDALEFFIKPSMLNAVKSKQVSGSGIVSIFKRFGFCNNFFGGKVQRGSVRIGQKVLFHPTSGATGIVESIGMNNDNTISYAQYGDCVGIKIKGLSKAIGRNDIMLCMPDDYIKNDVLFPIISKQIESFNVTVLVMYHPYRLYCKTGRDRCYNALVYVDTARTCCKMIKINWKISGKTKEVSPSFVKAGDKANIELMAMKFHPIIVTSRKHFEKYARIVVHEASNIVMCGYVTDVNFFS